MSTKLLLLPGDGIGPEVMNETRRIIELLNSKNLLDCEISEDFIGGAAYDLHGTPLADETLEKARNADAILLGAVGGPKWDDVPYDLRPEAGLLKLRKELDLFANLRPAIVFDALIDESALKPDLVQGLDLLIVRELTGGVYFGEPRGIETLPNGQRKGTNTHTYTSPEIHRIGKLAFELARTRNHKLCSADKANVMEAGKLWREEISGMVGEYPDVELSHMYADNLAMQLVKNPKQFDVIVTDNLFGDILSDEASMLTGSLGMLPSACLGAVDETGKQPAMYEPVHGSAPDIAGQGVANPCAMILSLAMCLRYSLGRDDLSNIIISSVEGILENQIRPTDLGGNHTTDQVGTAICRQIQKTLSKAA